MYQIEEGSFKAARKHNVIIRPATNVDKKIDIFNQDDKKIATIGANGMKDYWKYLKEDGIEVAKEHRRRYKIRHNKDRHVYHSNGWWADKILW